MQKATNTTSTDEYSGVVELQAAAQRVLDTKEIETMLAKSFDLETNQVEVLSWSRLH